MDYGLIIGLGIAFAIGAGVYFFLLKKKDPPQSPATLPPASRPPVVSGNWIYRYSANFVPLADGFEFPVNQDGIHYVVTPANVVVPPRLTLRFRIDTSSAAFVPVNDNSGTSARVRLFLQRRGDPLDLSLGPSYRFWSTAYVELTHGEWELSAALEPDQWTNVNGQRDDVGFAALLADLEWIGFTFGGMFAGHGVYATGPARFTMLEYS